MWGFDFNHFYISSRFLLAGQNPYLKSLEPMSREMGFEFARDLPIPHYPPSFLWLFAPLASLPPRAAFNVWLLGEIFSLGVLLWVARLLLSERLSRRGWTFLCGATIASQPVFMQFYFSQVQLLLAAMALGAYACHRRGWDTPACLAIAAAGLLKFYPFVLLPWFLWRSKGSVRARIGRTLAVLAFGLLTFLITGPQLWRDFFRFGIPVAAKNEVGRNFHYALPSFVTNLGFASSGFSPSPTIAHFWWAIGSAAGLLVIGLAYFFCYHGGGDEEMEFCLVCVAMMAGTVTVQGHYFVWLVFPVACAALRVAARPSVFRVLFLGLVVLLLNEITPPSGSLFPNSIYLRILINYFPFYGLMALGLFLAQELLKRAPLRTGGVNS
ncbi:MAG TPA: glycosyltransferase family 87 protein [Verrucomicrobiae bacterium]|nr:glycosyltransferase family 87 protein [Verrucomicrobiae bacterium]